MEKHACIPMYTLVKDALLFIICGTAHHTRRAWTEVQHQPTIFSMHSRYAQQLETTCPGQCKLNGVIFNVLNL